MPNVRVLVVDDSAAMRALFCDILDQAKGVQVVGTARNADEARDVIAELNPDVLTLDVEMPGMTGMEFLAELMETKPMPVIMLSSVTQEGTGTAQKAMELGAFDCFPKPLHTSQEEFTATVNKLGDIVTRAAQARFNKSSDAAEDEDADAEHMIGDYEPDGSLVVVAASSDSIEVMREVIAAFPANCPPTVILVDADTEIAERAVDRLLPSVACKIAHAESGAQLAAGTVYLAYGKDRHMVIENEGAPVIKMVERDPIAGHRPSADMLFASVARCGCKAIGGLLAASHSDGVRGLDALAKKGARTFVQEGDEVGPNSRFDAVSKLGNAVAKVPAKELGIWLVDASRAPNAVAA